MVGTIKKVSYNLKSQIDEFVKLFLDIDGIKEIMELIVESQRVKQNDFIQTLCNMLATCLLYKERIDVIAKKKPKKYFEKFFQLSAIDEHVKK